MPDGVGGLPNRRVNHFWRARRIVPKRGGVNNVFYTLECGGLAPLCYRSRSIKTKAAPPPHSKKCGSLTVPNEATPFVTALCAPIC